MSALTDLAEKEIGVPYVWGGASPSGFDCSGLMQWLYGQVGIKIPRTSREQKKAGTQISLQDAQPGDLVLFTYYGSASNPPPANHVGMYIGPGKMIDAPRPGKTVEVDPIDMAHLDSVVHFSGNTGAAGRADANAFTASAQNAGFTTISDSNGGSSWPGNILSTLGDAFMVPFEAGPSIVGGAVSGVATSILQGILVALGPIILTTLSIAAAGGLVLMGLWRMSQNTSAGKAVGDAAKVAAVA